MDKSLLIAYSISKDGSMSAGVSDAERLRNRTRFLQTNGVSADQTALVHLSYESEDFRRYFTVSSDQAGDGIVYPSSLIADALFTTNKNLALFLPIADCIAAVLYDPTHQVIGVAHLGRHNLVQSGGAAIVDYMAADFGTDPTDIQVWLSPAAGRQNYPLHDFDNRSLHEVANEQLMAGGVKLDAITIDQRDTTQDTSLFSHSEFLKGNRQSDGRQAVVAMMRPY